MGDFFEFDEPQILSPSEIKQRSILDEFCIRQNCDGHNMVTAWSQDIKKPLELPLSG